MLFLKRGLMAVGALALAAMLLNFVAPKSVHAAVATLVQVVNTAATPVPNRDVDAAGRNAYVLSCTASTSFCTTAAAPTGFSFVVDSLAIRTMGTAGVIEPYALLTYYASPTSTIIGAMLPLSPMVGTWAAAATNLTIYPMAGTAISVSTRDGIYVDAAIIGHLVSP